VIDAQVHIWGSGKPSGLHRQTSLYTAQELLLEMGQAGVDGAVLHPLFRDSSDGRSATRTDGRSDWLMVGYPTLG
jgi:hypothetical protein